MAHLVFSTLRRGPASWALFGASEGLDVALIDLCGSKLRDVSGFGCRHVSRCRDSVVWEPLRVCHQTVFRPHGRTWHWLGGRADDAFDPLGAPAFTGHSAFDGADLVDAGVGGDEVLTRPGHDAHPAAKFPPVLERSHTVFCFWNLEHHHLRKGHHFAIEPSARHLLPCSLSIFTDSADIDDLGGVPDHPGHDRILEADLGASPGLQSGPQCSSEALEILDCPLHSSVGIAVADSGLLHGRSRRRAGCSNCALDFCNGWLLICFDDQSFACQADRLEIIRVSFSQPFVCRALALHCIGPHAAEQ